jgi:AcrR family transcriptional regulator
MVKAMKTRKKNVRSPASGTAERHDQLREALLGAAERTVAAEGHQALRARALAHEVGCAVGAIYNVFPDLDALVLAAKARALDALDGALARAVARIDEPAGSGSTADEIAVRKLLALAATYLDFATERLPIWRMLFEYRIAPTAEVPTWYQTRLADLFVHVDAPLRAIVPDLAAEKRASLGRALFSAVHGVVALGLEQKLDKASRATIGAQAATIVRACVAGLMARERRDEIVSL